MTDEELAALIADDEFGLFVVKSKPTPKDSEEERLLSKFTEILSFVEANERPPSDLAEDRNERLLAVRLQAIRKSPDHCKALERFDEFGLLKEAPTPDATKPNPPAIAQDAFKGEFPPEKTLENSPQEPQAESPAESPPESPPASIDELLADPFSTTFPWMEWKSST